MICPQWQSMKQVKASKEKTKNDWLFNGEASYLIIKRDMYKVACPVHNDLFKGNNSR